MIAGRSYSISETKGKRPDKYITNRDTSYVMKTFRHK